MSKLSKLMNNNTPTKKELLSKVKHYEEILTQAQAEINQLRDMKLHSYLNSLIEISKTKIFPSNSEEMKVIKEKLSTGFNLTNKKEVNEQ